MHPLPHKPIWSCRSAALWTRGEVELVSTWTGKERKPLYLGFDEETEGWTGKRRGQAISLGSSLDEVGYYKKPSETCTGKRLFKLNACAWLKTCKKSPCNFKHWHKLFFGPLCTEVTPNHTWWVLRSGGSTTIVLCITAFLQWFSPASPSSLFS